MPATSTRERIHGIALRATLAGLLVHGASALAQGPAIVGMGDSIGEGVQAADAAWQTQRFGYLPWVAHQLGAPLTVPLIRSGFLGLVGQTSGRVRIFASQIGTNVAVSGATVHSLLNESANATSTGLIDSEADLVLYPRRQTQIEYVEAAAPGIVICWIGNNDALSAVTAFGNMNASQLTPLAAFDADYVALVDRLAALVASHGTKVVFANIPNVTDVGFLVDRATAERITGFAVALPDGSFTSLVGALMMRMLGNDNLVGNPDYVLDATEIATIEARIASFNAVIAREAARIGMPVVDVNRKFAELVTNPPRYAGFTLTKAPLGGLFSLDGIHPSTIGHGLLANEFIRTMNSAFGMAVPEIAPQTLTALFLTDPHIDKDGDGRARGRLGVGLLETLSFLFGVTGDSSDTLVP